MNKTKILLLLILAGCFNKETDKLINTKSKVETADIDKKDEGGWTKLHWAVIKGEDVKVEVILGCGASLEIEDNFGDTALCLAAKYRYNKIALFLLNRGAKIINEKCREMLFELAQRSKDIELAVRLLKLSRTSKTSIPLHLAAEQGKLEILKLFLEKEVADRNIDPITGQLRKFKNEAEIKSIVDEVDEDNRSALHISAINGRNFMIHHLLTYIEIYLGKNVVEKALSTIDKDGNTALHCAVISHQFDSVKALTQYNKSLPIDKLNNDNESALHLAVRTGDKKLVELLLEAGANIDIGTSNYYRKGPMPSICLTPLHIAIITQQPEMVEFLLERGANLDVKYSPYVDCPHVLFPLNFFVREVFKNYEISSEIEVAINREIEIAQALYKAEGSIKKFLASELASELELGGKLSDCWEKFKSLSKELKFLEDDHIGMYGAWQKLYDSILETRRFIAESKIEEIANEIWKAKCLIEDKSERLMKAKAKRLREEKAEDTSGSSELQSPPAKFQRTGLEPEVKVCCKEPEYEFIPLHLAVSRGYINEIKKQLKEGADANIANKDGNTSMHLAFKFVAGNKEIIKILLYYKADLHIKNKEGLSPLDLCKDYEVLKFLLMRAVKKGDIVTAETILMRMEDCSKIKEQDESTLLMYAAGGKDLNLVKNLVERKGCSVTDEDKDGSTVLMYAAEGGNFEIMNYLLGSIKLLFKPEECISYINKKNKFEDNALLIAALKGNVEVAKLLIESKADTEVHDSEGRTPLVIVGSKLDQKTFEEIRIKIASGSYFEASK